MDEKSASSSLGQATVPPFDPAEEAELCRLFETWRRERGLGANDENRFAHLLGALVASRAADVIAPDSFLRLVRPFAGNDEFGEDESREIIRAVMPLTKVHGLTADEKKELAQLFDRYHMRLWSKLQRSISARVEAKFDPADVLQEAYIRAMTRWSARPAEVEKQYVWLYGIVHEQFIDMLRKLKAVKRGDGYKHVQVPDNSAAEVASQFWQSQTGASTIAARREFVARVQEFLARNLEPIELEIFSMRVFDRLEFPEIVAEFVRRAEAGDRAGMSYQEFLDKLDSRSRDEADDAEDVNQRRADAIRKRFKRAVVKLTGTILAEFPELLDALPNLQLRTMTRPSRGS